MPLETTNFSLFSAVSDYCESREHVDELRKDLMHFYHVVSSDFPNMNESTWRALSVI